MVHATRARLTRGGLAGLLCAGLAAAWPATAAGLPPPPPQALDFADFHARPIGPRGPQPSARLLAADGTRVRISGYMAAQERPTPGRFFLVPTPLVLSEHADGDADDLPASAVTVLMPPADRDLDLQPTRGLLRLTGTLQLGRVEHEDGRVSWIRLLLEPRDAAP